MLYLKLLSIFLLSLHAVSFVYNFRTSEIILQNGTTFYLENVHRKDETAIKFSLGGGQINSTSVINSTLQSFILDDDLSQIELSTFQVNDYVTEYYFRWHAIQSPLQVQSDREVCFHYGFNDASWYNGYHSNDPKWPMDIEKKIERHNFVLRTFGNEKEDYFIVEYLYANSDGFALLLDEHQPLYMRRQPNGNDPLLCFSVNNTSPFKTNSADPNYLDLKFSIFASTNVRTVTDYVVHSSGHIPKPEQIPDERLFQHSFWYARDGSNGFWSVNQSIYIDFTNKVIANGFERPTIALNVWEKTRGDYSFDLDKFPVIDNMVSDVRRVGSGICLEVYPTVNSKSILTEEYFLKDNSGHRTDLIDFSNADACAWFSATLKRFRYDKRIDSFLIWNNVYSANGFAFANETYRKYPNLYHKKYIETVYEANSNAASWIAYRTQHLPIFINLIFPYYTKFDSVLESIIPQALSVSMAGYSYFTILISEPFYRQGLTDEIYIRMTQAAALMPRMAFFHYPWKYNAKTIEITQKYVDLHNDFAPKMIELARKRVTEGSPIIRPMWYVEPDDVRMYKVDDQFMLGEDVLVAPVLKEKKSKTGHFS